jgi:hypothetical protein
MKTSKIFYGRVRGQSCTEFYYKCFVQRFIQNFRSEYALGVHVGFAIVIPIAIELHFSDS